MDFCQCKDQYHKDNPYDGVCNMRVKKDFKNCYFCFMGHKIPDTDNDPLTGTDESDLSRRYEASQEKAKFNEQE